MADVKSAFEAKFREFVQQGDDPNTAAAKAVAWLRENEEPGSQQHQADHDKVPETPPCSAAAADAAASAGASLMLDPQPSPNQQKSDLCAMDDSEKSTTESTVNSVPMEIDGQGPPSPPPFSLEELDRLIQEASASGTYTSIIRKVGSILSDPALVVKTFCGPGDQPKLQQAREMFAKLEELDQVAPAVGVSLQNAMVTLSSQVAYPFENNLSRRLIPTLVALEYTPFQYDPDHVTSVSSLFRSIEALPKDGRERLLSFFQSCEDGYLQSTLGIVQMFITLKLTMGRAVADFYYVKEGMAVLDVLHDVFSTREFCDYTEFYNGAVNELATEMDEFLGRDITEWFRAREAREEARETGQPMARVSFREHPYVLDPGSKARILQIDNRIHQRLLVHDDMQQSGNRSLPFLTINPYFVVRVRREEIVDDFLNILHRTGDERELKKTLKVKFEGEEGVDEGGVQKEFFLLMVRQLFDPQFNMFKADEESRLLWFNGDTFETKLKFELVGVIIGLAIYNGVILDLNFPKAFYKKLIGFPLQLDDLKDLSPQLWKSLNTLLGFQGDVEETFAQTFQVTHDVFGEIRTYDLKENGGDIPVTNANCKEYVALYVDWFLNKSVEGIYTEFKKGFDKVCSDSFLSVFRPDELELLLCGSTNLNFEDLEKSCRYEDGYTVNSATIKYFWQTIHALSEEDKKRFLMFCTGSDRVPIRGLASLMLTISRHGPDSDLLPTAHTCFNHLLLPEYASGEKLKEKLVLAISHSTGFGTL